MSTIEGLGERTVAQIREELPQGGRFVVYRYAVSVVVVTLRLSSEVQYVPPGRSRVRHGLRWILITCFLGWWGIPWGPIYSIQSSATGSIDLVRRSDGDLLFEQRTIAADGGTSVVIHVPAREVPRLLDALHAGEDEDLVPALRRQSAALAEHGPLIWLRGHDVAASVLDAVH